MTEQLSPSVAQGTCYVGFVAAAVVLNMMIPYYKMHGSAALADAFRHVHLPFGKYCIGIGAMFGLLGNSIASMMMMPRFLYSMSQDGLLFGFFGKVHGNTGIPFYSTMVAGLLTSVMALLLELHALVEMVSIGTILAYTLVTLSVLILRYQPESVGMVRRSSSRLGGIRVTPTGGLVIDPDLLEPSEEETSQCNGDQIDSKDPSADVEVEPDIHQTMHDVTSSIDQRERSLSIDPTLAMSCRTVAPRPSSRTQYIAMVCTALLVTEIFAITGILRFLPHHLFKLNLFILIPFIVILLSAVITSIVLAAMPQNSQALYFKVPMLPWVPILAVFFNIYLMFGLSRLTWIRFGVWLIIGLLIYFLYGFWHSKQRYNDGEDLRQTIINSEPNTNGEDSDDEQPLVT